MAKLHTMMLVYTRHIIPAWEYVLGGCVHCTLYTIVHISILVQLLVLPQCVMESHNVNNLAFIFCEEQLEL